MKSRLCVTVTANTTAELRRKRDEAARDADMVELRLDSVSDPDVTGALAGRRTPALVTCRPTWEGGAFRGSEEERTRLLSEALSLGAEYVDLEWRARLDDLVTRAAGRRIVVSMHDPNGVPTDLWSRLRSMRATGAEFVKIAVRANRLSDCAVLHDLGVKEGQSGGLVLVAMGEYGLPARVLAGRFGSAWTYAGSLTELGQITPSTLRNEYHFRSLTESTGVYGLVGGSVAHSVSPAMHNAAFRSLQLNAVYLPLPAVSADDFIAFGRAIGIKGASVTIPHKVTLFDRLDEVYASARRIGAINTIRVENGRWVGDNTDAGGFLAALGDGVELNGLRASVLGAGGAARAVAVALASRGCSVHLHARRREEAEKAAVLVGAGVGAWPPRPGTWDVLINCTPVGQYPRVDDMPLPADQLTGGHVYDLVYNPQVTRLLREAANAGCHTIGGLGMLVAQAEEQFRWWTGVDAPRGVMREAARKRLAEFARDENHVV